MPLDEYTITNAMSLANANATGFVELARGALTAATSDYTRLGFTSVDWTSLSAPSAPTTSPLPPVPSIVPPTLNLPADPGEVPDIADPKDIDIGVIPPFTATPYEPPALNEPSSLAPAPTKPDITTAFNFPDAPSALSSTLPPPVLQTRAVPVAPTMEPVMFEGGPAPRPVDAPPENFGHLFETTFAEHTQGTQTIVQGFVQDWQSKMDPEAATQNKDYTEILQQFIKGELTTRTGGTSSELGTGLPIRAENALVSRVVASQKAALEKSTEAVYAEAARRGFTMPTGFINSAVMQARQVAATAQAISQEGVFVAQAELEQKNRQFAITLIKDYRTLMFNGALQYMQQVVSILTLSTEYAKASFSSMVEVYNTKVRYYSAQVEFYKGQIEIYDAKIRAGMAKIEIYKGELSALSTLTQVDTAKISMYQSQIAATSALINLYKAQIDAVLGKVSLEKSKIEIFQAQTQAYGAEVQAKNSEWSAYTAKLSGQEARMRMFDSQVQVFRTQVEGYKTTIESKIAATKAQLETNTAKISGYNSKVQGYNARVAAESAKSQAHNENNRTTIVSFERDLAEFHGRTQLELAKYGAENEVKLRNAEGDFKAKVESAHSKSQYGLNLAQLSSSSSNLWGQLAGSAMSGVNTLAAGIANV